VSKETIVSGSISLNLTRLDVHSFRNHLEWRLDLGDPGQKIVCLNGPNGAGKTNILEAISFLVPGRGLRGASLLDCKRHHTVAPWTVSAHGHGLDGPIQIGVGLADDKKIIRINGQNARLGQLGNHWRMLWLTPLQDRLFAEGGSERRRFLDRLVFSLAPEHGRHCNQYEKNLRERSRVLRDHPHDHIWLSALEAGLAETGFAITLARLALVEQLNNLPRHQTIFPDIHLSLNGTIEDIVHAKGGIEEIQQKLAANRRLDQQTASNRLGPHRSDWRARHLGRDIDAADGSTGEQKAVLLAVILAHARWMKARIGAAPILLLDEITAHLDETRRRGLWPLLADLGSQIWMTGTESSLFQGLEADTVFSTIGTA